MIIYNAHILISYKLYLKKLQFDFFIFFPGSKSSNIFCSSVYLRILLQPFPTTSQMSFLKESLNKFKQQQVKCQTTLTSIASRSSNSKDTQYQKSNSKPTNYSAPAKPHTMIKFSNDTERLQHINTIRKSPIGAQIKRVIDLLLEVYLYCYDPSYS